MNGQHLRTMLWLRWRLTINQWERRSPVSAVVSVIGLLLGLSLVIAGGLGGMLGGAFGLGKASPTMTMMVWDGAAVFFFFGWSMGVIMELQRSEIIDLSRLLHLPVALRDVFFLNYIASHLSFMLALMAPVMLGMTLGMIVGRGPIMLLLVPAVITFFFMITAWTYCLRGWLASLMNNQRRRRTIIMAITLTFVVLSQLPNLIVNSRRFSQPDSSTRSTITTREEAAAKKQETVTMVEQANRIVPVLWLPLSAWALAAGNVWPALGGALGMFVIGTLGLRRAYRSTIRFYQGADTNSKAVLESKPAPARKHGRLLVERVIPWLPEEAAALALANFRSLSRAPEVKLALASNVFIFAILGAQFLWRRSTAFPASFLPWLAPVAAIATLFGMGQLLFNQFGYDREGFRTLVLLPTPRRFVLLGKNLSLLPVALLLFTVFLALFFLLARLPFLIALAGLLDLGTAFLIMSMIGNLISICLAYRIVPGSMKPTKVSAGTSVAVGFSTMLSPLAMSPILIPVGLGLACDHWGWFPGTAVLLVSSAILLGLVGWLYWNTLPAMGRLLQQHEQKILATVTQEQE